MSDKESSNTADHYADCHVFVSPSGKSGFALGTGGNRTGELYDVFASPLEKPGTVDGLMSLAIQNGADKLVTYEHPLLAKFFEQFAFQATSIVNPKAFKSVPQGWMPESASESDPMSWPNFLYMIRLRSRAQVVSFDVLQARASSTPGETNDSNQVLCTRCGQVVARSGGFGMFGGYDCLHCKFIYVCGTLTLGPRPRSF